MTETTSTFTGHSAEDYQFRPDSSGPCLPIGDAKVIDDAGNELPAGAVGDLCVRGPNVVRGYWGKPEATAETFVDGWLRTGDLARLDDEGFVFIVDRKKDMLIRGGENIYCSEVEAVLFEHPGVMDAAVIGLAHHTLGEEPAAVVTLKAGAQATEQELRAFVAARLASFKVPVRIAFSGQTAAAKCQRQDHEARTQKDSSRPEPGCSSGREPSRTDRTHACGRPPACPVLTSGSLSPCGPCHALDALFARWTSGFGTLDNDRIHLHEGDLFDAPVPTGRMVAAADVQWLTPCLPGKFICLWNNFHAAAAKQSLAIPAEPLWIIKAGSALRAHGEPIVAPAAQAYDGRVVYEGELGVVIGRRCRDVSEADAPAAISDTPA
jgi:hypothetical protein